MPQKDEDNPQVNYYLKKKKKGKEGGEEDIHIANYLERTEN